jgi:molybdopterin guanine dinucleotide-containing S/N-oxide reductase-like protein
MESNGEKILTSMVGDFAGGNPVFVHIKDGRIIRIRPMIFGEDEAKPWSLKVGDRVFANRKRSNPAPWDLSVRRRTYNPKRVQYPLMRVGFEPGGKSSTENRGRGEFARISWDEALDIVVSELKRIKEKYGNSAILTIASGHGSHGLMNGHSVIRRPLELWGGHTRMIRNPDSWEGWYWGAEHAWGFDKGCGVGNLFDLLEDTLQNSELSICWSHDAEQSGLTGGQDRAEWILWLKELGKKMIFISPDLNFTGGTKADKWIPIRAGTDAALAAAIAYVWISEGTYEKEYVYTHGVGFDKWKEYVMGDEDGIPKTPEWAEEITGVSAPVTRALAREWAAKRTHLSIRYGTASRTPYSTEWPRMVVYLQTMQGMGKPGVSIHPLGSVAPLDVKVRMPIKGVGETCMFNAVASTIPQNPVKQTILQTLLPDAILNPPVSWYAGEIAADVEKQFIKFTYPMTGCSEIHMIWWDTVSNVANWNNTNKWAEAYRSPKVEFGVAQSSLLENDALFADIVLPLCTQLEREDFNYPGLLTFGGAARDIVPGEMRRGSDVGSFTAVYMKECIKPLYESKSDYEIARLVAERLGIEQEFTEGNTVEDWMRKFYEASSVSEHISFEEFKEKGYYVFKFPDDWERTPGLRDFYKTATGLKTPSGKIEFYSQRLADNFPGDKERPPVAHYIAEGETHQESLSSARAKKYPLLMESPHPRYRFHSQHETVSWLWEIPAHKIRKDSQYYECVWISRQDAEARGIKYGDLVRIFNERGSVLYAAHVTERMMPGVVRAPNGSGYNPVKVGDQHTGLPINTIAPFNTTSKNASGMAVNAFLVQVEKWEGK